MFYRILRLFFFLLFPIACVFATTDRWVNKEANKTEAWSEQAYHAEDLPLLPLTSNIFFRVLVGDIAAQRGDGAQATQSWLEVAHMTKDPRAAHQAVAYGILFDQTDRALTAAEIWVSTAPRSRLAKEAKMLFLLKSNHIDEVDAHFDQWLGPGQFPAFLMEMSGLWDKKTDMNAVLRLNNRVLVRFPTLPEAYFARAATFAIMNRQQEALADLDEALRLRPEWREALLYKVQLLEIVDSDALDRFLNASIKAHPFSVDYMLLLAKRQAKLGQLTLARKSYEWVLRRSPESPEALVGAGLIAEKEKDYPAAETLLRSALKTAQNLDPILILLGGLAELQYHFQQAIDWYSQVSHTQYHSNVVQRLAWLYAKLGQQEKAFQAIAGLPTGSDEEKYQKILIEAQMWRGLKNYPKAAHVLDSAIETWPDSKDFLMERSLAKEAAGDYASAELDLRKLLALLPDDLDTLNALGYLLASRTDRLNEAATYLERAYAQDLHNPAVMDSLGWLRFRQGKIADALALLEQAYQRFPDPEIAAHYAQILWQSGKIDEAKKVLENAIRQEPGHEAVMTARKKLGI